MHWVLQLSCRQDSVGSDLPQQIEEGTPQLNHCPQAGVGTFLIGAPAPQCSLHEEERVLKVIPKITGRGSQRDGPEHPSVWTLIGAAEEAIIQVAEQVYWG